MGAHRPAARTTSAGRETARRRDRPPRPGRGRPRTAAARVRGAREDAVAVRERLDDRCQELDHHAEREFALHHAATGPEDGHALCLGQLRGRREQRALADPRRSLDHDDPARAGRGGAQRPTDLLELGLALQQARHPTTREKSLRWVHVARRGGSAIASLAMRTPRPTYAGVTATLALFTALGGSAFAAATITGVDVTNGSLTSSDVRNGSLKSRDIDNGSLTGATAVVARRVNATVAPGPGNVTFEPASASCQEGEVAVGGGAGITNVVTGLARIVMSEPVEDDGSPPEDGEIATRWRAVGANSDNDDPQTMNVHVLCASP